MPAVGPVRGAELEALRVEGVVGAEAIGPDFEHRMDTDAAVAQLVGPVLFRYLFEDDDDDYT